uniref:Uncharacterized protein n=1 Tax=Rhizophagus irregularis (strain DAOM 181602 / DAOM 197198 / MUCL 43194) TaxID=747089 RepID=U9SLT7_RHIID
MVGVHNKYSANNRESNENNESSANNRADISPKTVSPKPHFTEFHFADRMVISPNGHFAEAISLNGKKS